MNGDETEDTKSAKPGVCLRCKIPHQNPLWTIPGNWTICEECQKRAAESEVKRELETQATKELTALAEIWRKKGAVLDVYCLMACRECKVIKRRTEYTIDQSGKAHCAECQIAKLDDAAGWRKKNDQMKCDLQNGEHIWALCRKCQDYFRGDPASRMREANRTAQLQIDRRMEQEAKKGYTGDGWKRTDTTFVLTPTPADLAKHKRALELDSMSSSVSLPHIEVSIPTEGIDSAPKCRECGNPYKDTRFEICEKCQRGLWDGKEKVKLSDLVSTIPTPRIHAAFTTCPTALELRKLSGKPALTFKEKTEELFYNLRFVADPKKAPVTGSYRWTFTYTAEEDVQVNKLHTTMVHPPNSLKVVMMPSEQTADGWWLSHWLISW